MRIELFIDDSAIGGNVSLQDIWQDLSDNPHWWIQAADSIRLVSSTLGTKEIES